MKLYIKNMVCVRCKMVVKLELDKLGIRFAIVDMGTVDLMEDKKPILIERKNKKHHCRYGSLSEKLNHDYKYLSNLFSEVQGITI